MEIKNRAREHSKRALELLGTQVAAFALFVLLTGLNNTLLNMGFPLWMGIIVQSGIVTCYWIAIQISLAMYRLAI